MMYSLLSGYLQVNQNQRESRDDCQLSSIVPLISMPPPQCSEEIALRVCILLS